jgi:carboxylesterase
MRWPRWLHAPHGTVLGPGTATPVRLAGSAPAVLALHGFGGTPRDVDLVVGVARDLGLAAWAPLLPGHGGQVSELAKTRFNDWHDAADAALTELTTDGPAVVVGLSMGAILAARLAARRPRQVCALGLLSNALWLPTRTSLLLDAAATLRLPDLWRPKHGSDLRDPDARRLHLTSAAQPTRSAISLLQGARDTRRMLDRIAAPVLIAHGLDDRVCPVANARRAAALLTGTTPRLLTLPRSGHIITRDGDRARLYGALRSFLADTTLGPAAL